MIIALSDIHLGFERSNESDFRSFADSIKNSDELEHFVIVGDFLDMWRREPAKLMLEYYDIFEILKEFRAEVHYVIGNHDYHVIELKKHFEEKFKIDVCSDLTLKSGDVNYHFIHGYQYEWKDNLALFNEFANILALADDETGKDAEKLWKFYRHLMPSFLAWLKNLLFPNKIKEALLLPEKRLSKEKLSGIEKAALAELGKISERTGIKELFLVYGHTHRARVDEQNKIANTGAWVSEPLVKNIKNTYLEINEQKVNLKYYE